MTRSATERAFYVVSMGYQRVLASSPRGAVVKAAANPRQGEGRDLVVKTERDAKAILSNVVPHVAVSPSGAVSVTMNVKACA